MARSGTLGVARSGASSVARSVAAAWPFLAACTTKRMAEKISIHGRQQRTDSNTCTCTCDVWGMCDGTCGGVR
eukprot:5427359-Prymnesium_polylepis.1